MNKELWGRSYPELQEIVKEEGFPAFTAGQIADWLYRKNARSISEMTNLSKKNRSLLEEKYTLTRHEPLNSSVSRDGTKKYLFEMAGNFIEAAYIPDEPRSTLCISSQAGCRRQCRFCMTGKQGLQADLTSGEILSQIYGIPEWEKLTNIVVMGMGEPLDNTENVLRALDILTSEKGLAWSPKRITLSTVGILPGLERFITTSQCHLALSLHNPFPEERRQIMPIEAQYPLMDVLKLIRDSGDFRGQRRFSVEYILFEGFNDDTRHARELVRILNGLKVRVNLIAWHPVPDMPFTGSPRDKIEAFQQELQKKGITTTIRRSRGLDIQAACGLLSTLEKVQKGKDQSPETPGSGR